MRQILKSIYDAVTHQIGKLTGKYYFEDYVRVYSEQLAYNRFGQARKVTPRDLKNFLNHQKFYRFAAQFVSGKRTADIGCGSGHGCQIFLQAGAAEVSGCDLSQHSISYAKEHQEKAINFSVQGVTHLSYPDDAFDVTVSSEVLEHIKEYGQENIALLEMKRVTRENGIIIVATPNNEMVEDHGFSYEEIVGCFETAGLPHFAVFENAFIPAGKVKDRWEKRVQGDRTGIIVTENINFVESVWIEQNPPEIKQGIEPGMLDFEGFKIDTRLLHNTHSWIVVALKKT